MDLPFEQLLVLIIAGVALLIRLLRGSVANRRERVPDDDVDMAPTPTPTPLPRRPNPSPRPVSEPAAGLPLPPYAGEAPRSSPPVAPLATFTAEPRSSAEPDPWALGARPESRSATPGRSGRPRVAEVLHQPEGLRRSIAAMTVLGPPRSLDPPT